jgi:hypothetical protein
MAFRPYPVQIRLDIDDADWYDEDSMRAEARNGALEAVQAASMEPLAVRHASSMAK